MRPPRFQVIVDAVLVVLFASALSAPLVGMWLGIGQLQASEEKRQLAPLPNMTLNFRWWTTVPFAFTAYFNDHFGFRKTLVLDHAAFLVKVLGESTTPDVVVGKKGWLYFSKDRYMDSFRGQESFVPGELDQWVTALRRMRDWLASRGIPFYVIIPPDKHTIYPEYLPSSVTLNAGATRLDTLTAALREANIDVIDVRDALRRAKSTGPLYHRTDTHWNGDGGYVAYRAMLLEIGRRFPQVRPYPRSYFRYWPRRYTGDLNYMLGLTEGYEENLLFLLPKVETAVSHQEGRTVISERNDPQLPRMVMMRDSFGNFLTTLLTQNFSRATFLWDNNFNPELMEREKPDLVLFEIVERRLADGAPVGPQ
jgi:alginate O-acetyltransferase complex protein AlgJ